MEVWKDIEGYEGKYQVSDHGNVKSLSYRRTSVARNLVPKINNDGYMWVDLWKDGVSRQFLVHRLVALAFVPNPNNFPEVNHKDENKARNLAENIEWCDHSYNVAYSRERHLGWGRGWTKGS